MMNVLCCEVFYGLAMVCHPLFLGIFFQKNKVLSAKANRKLEPVTDFDKTASQGQTNDRRS